VHGDPAGARVLVQGGRQVRLVAELLPGHPLDPRGEGAVGQPERGGPDMSGEDQVVAERLHAGVDPADLRVRRVTGAQLRGQAVEVADRLR
jgi:hypothetical protein